MADILTKTIELNIAGRRFPIKVSENEESMARDIEEDLNQKINDFQLKYKNRDKLDCVIMTLLTASFEGRQDSIDHDQETKVIQQLEKIDSLLESHIH